MYYLHVAVTSGFKQTDRVGWVFGFYFIETFRIIFEKKNVDNRPGVEPERVSV